MARVHRVADGVGLFFDQHGLVSFEEIAGLDVLAVVVEALVLDGVLGLLLLVKDREVLEEALLAHVLAQDGVALVKGVHPRVHELQRINVLLVGLDQVVVDLLDQLRKVQALQVQHARQLLQLLLLLLLGVLDDGLVIQVVIEGGHLSQLVLGDVHLLRQNALLDVDDLLLQHVLHLVEERLAQRARPGIG